MKICLFGYAWNPENQPDAYMIETISAFAEIGVSVDVYLASQFSEGRGIYGLNPALSTAAIVEHVRAQGYDMALAFNNAMLLPEMLAAIPGRVVTMVVDEPQHLFNHLRGGLYDVFHYDIEVVALSSALERRLLANVSGIQPRLHFMSPVTRPELRTDPAETPRHTISWVASMVGDTNLDQYFELAANTPGYYALAQLCLDIVERDGDLRALKTGEPSQALELIGTLPWSFDYFEMQMQNIVTNRQRLSVVERLAPHGLALFGNSNWRRLMASNKAVLDAFQPGPAVASHADLRKVYDASKIAINLPQRHVSQEAIQYRVVDIMASNALLITHRSDPSDLYRIFGEDCPVPTFGDQDELERLCAHYLRNEDERLAVVHACNALVRQGFSFRDRALDLLRIAGLVRPNGTGATPVMRWVDLTPFGA
ncbi:hypothetical protein PMI01_00212 [Caulobacter sp. AP07]|uniref:glycosyltransferase family protein n=1 Tax=Caulobacter sp. AP07 TaxID=1144304 RepID=UPI00027200EC|nr:glycosyltransferase [Caulobacter sp. AP07]EJL38187.1 hypothetical protein PMI01_00212 [Caulobacter sp. AP07]